MEMLEVKIQLQRIPLDMRYAMPPTQIKERMRPPIRKVNQVRGQRDGGHFKSHILRNVSIEIF